MSTKEWHTSVTADMRSLLVHKLVQAICPRRINPRDLNNLVSYARMVEADFYDSANSNSHYYHLLAEKIYKIQREQEKNRARRRLAQVVQQVLEELQQAQQQQPLHSSEE